MTKKIEKKLQDSNKSSIFAPEMVFEKCSATPCNAWKPKEAMGIREMLIRTQKGQRLDVNTRFRAEGIPDNMYQAKYDAQGRILPDSQEDTFDHTPPDGVADIVDVIRLQEETNQRKEELKRRSKKTIANADVSAPTPKKSPDNAPESREAPPQPKNEGSQE